VIASKDEVKLVQGVVSRHVRHEPHGIRDYQERRREALGKHLQGSRNCDQKEEQAASPIRARSRQSGAFLALPRRSIEVVPHSCGGKAGRAAADAYAGERDGALLLADEEGPGLDDGCAQEQERVSPNAGKALFALASFAVISSARVLRLALAPAGIDSHVISIAFPLASSVRGSIPASPSSFSLPLATRAASMPGLTKVTTYLRAEQAEAW
jgi:hypothetical protein